MLAYYKCVRAQKSEIFVYTRAPGPVHHSTRGARNLVQTVILSDLVCYYPGVHLVGNIELTIFGKWRATVRIFRGVSFEMCEQRLPENGSPEACSVRFCAEISVPNQRPATTPPGVWKCFQCFQSNVL